MQIVIIQKSTPYDNNITSNIMQKDTYKDWFNVSQYEESGNRQNCKQMRKFNEMPVNNLYRDACISCWQTRSSERNYIRL